jgi:hypothetical protein
MASTATLMFAGSSIALTVGIAAWRAERQRLMALTSSCLTNPEQKSRCPDTVPLSATEASHFSQRWYSLQCRFVDDPRAAVAEADRLVRELLEKRGYLERRTQTGIDSPFPDLPFDHSPLLTTYIAAQAITAPHGRSEADTEVLRKALVYYRALLTELLVDR